MGKDLRGREMGEGIMQRKDGLYSARYTNRRGLRVEKYFGTVSEARKWYMYNKLQDEHEDETARYYTDVKAEIGAEERKNERRNPGNTGMEE